MKYQFRQTRTPFLLATVGAGVLFSVWLAGILGIIEFGGAGHPLCVIFQLVLVLPVFCCLVYRLMNPKDCLELGENYLVLRSLYLFPKVVRIPKAIVSGAEWCRVDYGEGPQNTIRIFLSDPDRLRGFRGNFLFRIKDGNFECARLESKRRILEMVEAIKEYINVEPVAPSGRTKPDR